MSDEDLIAYLKVLNAQIKLQQEVRDRWFGYYLTLAGSILGICIAIIKFLYEVPLIGVTLSLLLILSVLMFLIGNCFFMIYLKQRENYVKNYVTIDAIERKLIPAEMFNESILQIKRSPSDDRESEWDKFFGQRHHNTRVNGADYYTVWIHIIINSFYASCAGLLVSMHLRAASRADGFDIGAGICVFVVSCFALEITRRFDFRRLP